MPRVLTDSNDLWFALGRPTGSSFRYLAFTGCDTVSAFAGRGKKTAWNTRKAFPEVIHAFNELQGMSSEVHEESISLLERFVY